MKSRRTAGKIQSILHGISISFTTCQIGGQGLIPYFYLRLTLFVYFLKYSTTTFQEVEKVVQQQVKQGNIAGLLTLQRQIAQAVGTGTILYFLYYIS